MARTGGAKPSNPSEKVPSNPWGKSSEKVTSKPCVKPINPREKVTSNPCLVIKTPKQSDKYMCPASSYRELQQKLRKAFQKKIENMSKDKTACLHPCEFPHCVENC